MAKAETKDAKRDISTLRSTIDWLVSEGDIIVSDTEVNPDLEITALQKKLDGSVGLLFNQVKGYPHIRAITNMFADRHTINKIFGWKDETDRTRKLAPRPDQSVGFQGNQPETGPGPGSGPGR